MTFLVEWKAVGVRSGLLGVLPYPRAQTLPLLVDTALNVVCTFFICVVGFNK